MTARELLRDYKDYSMDSKPKMQKRELLPWHGLCNSLTGKDAKLLKMFEPTRQNLQELGFVLHYGDETAKHLVSTSYWASEKFDLSCSGSPYRFCEMRQTICYFIAAMKGDL
jgi:hypothetical protein